ncbi:radical SAM protein, partial [archaeon]|nr:radical SAM protein [archaeon]
MISQEDKEKAIHDKRKHIRITSLCNNNCSFCLAGDMSNEGHYEIDRIKKELEDGIKEGCTRVILSGGEPSIHPDFPKIIKLAKSIGYKKIQTISNGRMFSYRKFLNDCIGSGLSEITFSIHGHTSEIHDALTRT